MMPVMDGLEAAEYIRRKWNGRCEEDSDSGTDSAGDIKNIVECSKSGMGGHLTKPIEAQKLKERFLHLRFNLNLQR